MLNVDMQALSDSGQESIFLAQSYSFFKAIFVPTVLRISPFEARETRGPISLKRNFHYARIVPIC